MLSRTGPVNAPQKVYIGTGTGSQPFGMRGDDPAALTHATKIFIDLNLTSTYTTAPYTIFVPSDRVSFAPVSRKTSFGSNYRHLAPGKLRSCSLVGSFTRSTEINTTSKVIWLSSLKQSLLKPFHQCQGERQKRPFGTDAGVINTISALKMRLCLIAISFSVLHRLVKFHSCTGA